MLVPFKESLASLILDLYDLLFNGPGVSLAGLRWIILLVVTGLPEGRGKAEYGEKEDQQQT